MRLTVRLDEGTMEMLERLSAVKGISRADVIRQGIVRLAQDAGVAVEGESLLNRRAHLVGSVHDGDPRRSETTGRHFRRTLSRHKPRP